MHRRHVRSEGTGLRRVRDDAMFTPNESIFMTVDKTRLAPDAHGRQGRYAEPHGDAWIYKLITEIREYKLIKNRLYHLLIGPARDEIRGYIFTNDSGWMSDFEYIYVSFYRG